MTRHLALDLGTTTLAGNFISASGELLAACQVANPQRTVGADILLRLQRAHEGAGDQLQTLLVEGVRTLVGALLGQAGCAPAEVASLAAACNPGMSCLLQGLPVSQLLFPPHKPPCRELTLLGADEVALGLTPPLQLFPPVSGFVGGDLVACLFALQDLKPGTLLIDLGTNAELALWDGGRWWVTSAAAGPAFEGGNIGAGMLRSEGAVTDVRLVRDRLQLTVAGDCSPRGLCGSGLAALVAAALEGGLIDVAGRILAADEVGTNLDRYLVERAGSQAIRFYRDAHGELLLSQGDLRNFQLAKGAVRAGTQLLLERGGFAAEDVSQVLITGALGTALPLEILKRVALLPEPMLDKTSFIANGVLAGLQGYLVATGGRQQLVDLMSRIQPFPLSGTPAFEKLFLESLEF